MKARFLPFEELTAEIADGLDASNIYDVRDYSQMVDDIATGKLKVFVLGGDDAPVYIAVSVMQSDDGTKVLSLDAVWVPGGAGWKFRSWREFLTRLARDWGCVRVETAVRDVRVLKGLLAIGSKVDYVAVRLEIENGQ